MADRERLEHVAAQVFAALAARDEGDSYAADARSALLAAEAFLRECDLRYPPEQPAAPTPGEPTTLLNAAKEMLAAVESGMLNIDLRWHWSTPKLRDAIAREESRRG